MNKNAAKTRKSYKNSADLVKERHQTEVSEIHYSTTPLIDVVKKVRLALLRVKNKLTQQQDPVN